MSTLRVGGLAAITILFIVACGGSTLGATPGATVGTAAPVSSAEPSAAPPDFASSAAASGDVTGGLPEACAVEIRAFLVAIEPLVDGVDFLSMTPSAFEQFSQTLEAPSEHFDPEACPDMDPAAAHAAYVAIAEDVAPGTFAYIDHVFSQQ